MASVYPTGISMRSVYSTGISMASVYPTGISMASVYSTGISMASVNSTVLLCTLSSCRDSKRIKRVNQPCNKGTIRNIFLKPRNQIL